MKERQTQLICGLYKNEFIHLLISLKAKSELRSIPRTRVRLLLCCSALGGWRLSVHIFVLIKRRPVKKPLVFIENVWDVCEAPTLRPLSLSLCMFGMSLAPSTFSLSQPNREGTRKRSWRPKLFTVSSFSVFAAVAVPRHNNTVPVCDDENDEGG